MAISLRQQQGFTLIELILVIIIIGILATLTTSFLSLGSRMYAETSDRDKLLSQSRFALERLTRELRNAMPNSVRVHTSAAGQCIEFVPVVVASRYDSIPIDAPGEAEFSFFGLASEWQTLAVPPEQIAGYRVFVYATDDEQIYQSGAGVSPGRFFQIDSAEFVASTSGFDVTLNFATPIYFSSSSPSNRIYLVNKPVSYCINSLGQLYRYADYEFAAIPSLSGGSLMAENLDPAESAFQIDNPSLSRNSIAHIVLVFQTTLSGNLFFNQEVHIPNVP